MTTNLLGGLVVPVLIGGGILGLTMWRSSARKLRRNPTLSPGRVVIASNLARSRRRPR